MKILQIVAAHYEQGSEPAVYGLGDDGNLYEWVCEMRACQNRVQAMELVPPELLEERRTYGYNLNEDGRPVRAKTVDGKAVLEDKFTNGRTEGWELKGHQMSKVVPHVNDPKRHKFE